MAKQVNPFIISGYSGKKYFCDREDETKRLCSELANGNNIALIATRRMGKTGLIRHCFAQEEIQKQYYTFFIDIYDTKNLGELVMKLSREILERLKPFGLKALQKFWDCVHSLQSGISFSPTGDVSFNLQLGDIQLSTNSLNEIFHYLSIADRPCIVAIDEFQQIAQYTETNVEATLRTHVQHCQNAQFIFAGSQRHTMGQMFTSASRPFFQSVSIMHLDSIDKQKYDTFAKGHFEEAGKTLQDGVTDKVYELSRGITWYSQKLFNTIFAHTAQGESADATNVSEALSYILDTQEFSYKETMFRLPEKQKLVLTALAKEGPARNITSAAFIRKYHLPSASTVQAAVKGLLEKDFITLEQGVYTVYDIFLGYWMQRQ